MVWGMSGLYGITHIRSRYTNYLERGLDDGKITEMVKRRAFSVPPELALAA